MPRFIYTVGHSNHSMDRFVELLSAHRISAVADIRSHPYSRFNRQYNQEALRLELRNAGLTYVFLGRELGARSEDPGCYVNGKVVYDLLARTALFQDGLSCLVRGAAEHRIAMMCAEKDPLTCHRGILVCRHLMAQGIDVQHILEDGGIETHAAALCRLLSELGLPESDLFRSRDEIVHDAYEQRGKQIAFVQPLLAAI